MAENRISIEFTEAEINAVTQAVSDLVAIVSPKLIALDASDKKAMTKVGEKSISFVEKTLEYARTNAEFLPAFVEESEFKKDVDAYKLLNSFLRPVQQLANNLDDTATLSGSEAMQSALAYYNSVRQANKMGVPNASAVYGDLKTRFENQKAVPKIPGTIK